MTILKQIGADKKSMLVISFPIFSLYFLSQIDFTILTVLKYAFGCFSTPGYAYALYFVSFT